MLKVLVVDDEMPIRQWLEFCIEKIDGVSLAGAASHGAEGYSLFRRTMPDVVITDIRMPVMDGLEMMQMIRGLNPAVYFIVLTSFEEFEYARKAMSLGAAEYILKTEISDEILRESLKKAADAIGRAMEGDDRKLEAVADRNYFLRSLVLTDAPAPCREAAMKEYGIRLTEGLYYGICVRLTDKGETIHRPKTGFLKNPMRFPVDEESVMILGNVTEGYEDGVRLREACREYCRAILDQADCVIGVSDPRKERIRMSESLMEAYRRTRKRFYHLGERIFTAGNPWCWRFEKEEKYKILFSKSLIAQDMGKAVQVKNELLEEIRAQEPLDVESVRQLVCYFMVSALHTVKEDVKKTEEEVRRIREKAAGCGSLKELEELADRFFKEHGMEQKSEKEYSQAVRRAIAYMEEHYGSSLALPDVASHVGLSAEYLSRLFREDTGLKFIVYLNNLRLKHAIELLENTNLKVYEVAERVGYSNLSYFSTVFKKNFGQNPFDYKNKMMGAAGEGQRGWKAGQ